MINALFALFPPFLKKSNRDHAVISHEVFYGDVHLINEDGVYGIHNQGVFTLDAKKRY